MNGKECGTNKPLPQPMSTQYNQLIELGQDKKLIAAAEVGAAPLPDLLQAYEAHWLWFTVWGGDDFIRNPDWNSPENLQTVRFCFIPKVPKGNWTNTL